MTRKQIRSAHAPRREVKRRCAWLLNPDELDQEKCGQPASYYVHGIGALCVSHHLEHRRQVELTAALKRSKRDGDKIPGTDLLENKFWRPKEDLFLRFKDTSGLNRSQRELSQLIDDLHDVARANDFSLVGWGNTQHLQRFNRVRNGSSA